MDAFALVLAVTAFIFGMLWLREKAQRERLQGQAAREIHDREWRAGAREHALKRNWEDAASHGNQELRDAYRRLEKADNKAGSLEKRVAELGAESRALEKAVEEQRQRVREAVRRGQESEALAIERSRVTDSARAAGQKLAERYAEDTRKHLLAKISPNNLETTKVKFERAIAFIVKLGFDTTIDFLENADAEFVAAFKDAVRKEEVRAQQAVIKEQIREEQRVERELAKAREQADREEKHIQEALTKALAKVGAEHSAEVAYLREQMTALEAKKAKISQAQLTKAGHVYVISNIGSFGDGVFKVGMTRRLEPQERVDELGDASVPFPFDVHMMISCDNAPRLENALHKELHERRLNKVNLRKEFFRASLDEIVAIVKREHGHVDYKADAIAEAYFESRALEERKALGAFVEPTADERSLEAAD